MPENERVTPADEGCSPAEKTTDRDAPCPAVETPPDVSPAAEVKAAMPALDDWGNLSIPARVLIIALVLAIHVCTIATGINLFLENYAPIWSETSLGDNWGPKFAVISGVTVGLIFPALIYLLVYACEILVRCIQVVLILTFLAATGYGAYILFILLF